MNVKTDIAANKRKKKEEPIVSNHIEVKSKPQQTNDQKPVENKNNDVVKNSAPLPAANTAAKITTTPKPDSLQILAVANKKKEANY